MKEKAVIFDLGGVLISLDYQLTVQHFIDLGIHDFQAMYSQAAQSNLFDRYETGDCSSSHFINLLLPFLPNGTSPNLVVKAWNAMILDFPKEKLDYLDELRARGIRIFLLSNTNELHLELVQRRLQAVYPDRNLESYFEEAFYSHTLHDRKPHASIFETVCNAVGIIPEDTLFIDDTAQHIVGAKGMGLQAHLLLKEENLREVVENYLAS